MKSKNDLAKNIGIYTIGNVGSKIFSYVIVLVYSYYISTEELGYYDLIHTTLSFVSPIILFEITEGAYRFVLSRSVDEKEIVIGTSILFLIISLMIAEVVFIVIASKMELRFKWWIALLIASTHLYLLLHEIVRGLENSKLYVVCGIFQSILMLSLVFICLVVFKFGVVSLFIAQGISYLVCCIYLIFKQIQIWKVLVHIINYFRISELENLMRYSVPLIPDAISWWCINSSDRYLILAFLGQSFNGLYSMANKFPTIITSIAGIFYMAWQESAIKEYDNPNRDSYYSIIFNRYTTLLLSLSLCAMPATRIIFYYCVGSAYSNAWIFTGFLFLGVVFKALSDFLSLGYQISGETKKSMVTTIIAAVINIGINSLFIKKIGLYAASFSTFIAFFALFLIRIRQAKQYFSLNIIWKRHIILFFLCIIMNISILHFKNIIIQFLLCFSGVLVLLKYNYSIFYPFVVKIIKKAKV